MKNAMKLLKSRTFWFNAITGAITVIDALNGKVIPVEISGAVVAIGNVVLRLLTTKSVSEK
jgi:hypothetical protein